MTRPSRIPAVWAVLTGATLASWALGERSDPGGWITVVFVLAVLKGALVALDFMELREAPPLWRRLVLGWLVGVVALILAVRALG